MTKLPRDKAPERGLRPIEIWEPDIHAASFRAEAHRQSLAAVESPHEAEDQAIIDAISIGPMITGPNPRAQPVKPVAPLRTSLIRAGLALAVIVCGLSLRWYGFPLGLPAFAVKYGGSLLWATMVFLLIGLSAPRLSRTQLASIAVVIAVAVELSRLVHVPWLDAFRLTTAGVLLLGRIFSLSNLLAYGIGIAFGIWIDGLVTLRRVG